MSSRPSEDTPREQELAIVPEIALVPAQNLEHQPVFDPELTAIIDDARELAMATTAYEIMRREVGRSEDFERFIHVMPRISTDIRDNLRAVLLHARYAELDKGLKEHRPKYLGKLSDVTTYRALTALLAIITFFLVRANDSSFYVQAFFFTLFAGFVGSTAFMELLMVERDLYSRPIPKQRITFEKMFDFEAVLNEARTNPAFQDELSRLRHYVKLLGDKKNKINTEFASELERIINSISLLDKAINAFGDNPIPVDLLERKGQLDFTSVHLNALREQRLAVIDAEIAAAELRILVLDAEDSAYSHSVSRIVETVHTLVVTQPSEVPEDRLLEHLPVTRIAFDTPTESDKELVPRAEDKSDETPTE